MHYLRESLCSEQGRTIFYGRHQCSNEFLECLAMLAERNSLAAIHRIKGIKDETVMDWVCEAANHIEEIEALLANYPLKRIQLDAMWTYVGHKGKNVVIPKKMIAVASGWALP
jgi:hypothetical protein